MQCKWPLPQQRVTRVTRNEEQHCTKSSSTTASGAGEIRKTDRRTAPELDNCEVDAARGLAAHHSCYRIVVVPSGMDGIRVSQASGTRPGMF